MAVRSAITRRAFSLGVGDRGRGEDKRPVEILSRVTWSPTRNHYPIGRAAVGIQGSVVSFRLAHLRRADSRNGYVNLGTTALCSTDHRIGLRSSAASDAAPALVALGAADQ
jgi:hypothetical protein